jgi:RNA polymerase sigma factor (sigma-70 family)
MQATEEVGREAQTDFSIRENGIGEMQDVLTRCLPRFYRSAYRQLGNAVDAEDAVQDAMLAAYLHLDQFKGQAQMSTWLNRHCYQLCANAIAQTATPAPPVARRTMWGG